jgi:hypothetical protein
MGDAPVLSHCSLLRNAQTKSTSVLEHCHEGESNCLLFIFGLFLSDRIPKG